MVNFNIAEMKGVIPAMITSFHNNEELNEQGLRDCINFLISKNVNGLYITGTTGEFFSMTTEERKRVVEITVDEVRGRIPIVSHIGSIGTHISIELAQHAQMVGVDGIASLPPFFYGFSSKQIFDYYNDIASSTDLPLIVYNMGNAGLLGFDMLKKLSSINNVIGVKYTATTHFDIMRIKKEIGNHFIVYSGTDEMAMSGLLSGADGLIGSFYNLMPETFLSIKKALENNDVQQAKSLQEKANIVIFFSLARQYEFAIIKRGMEWQGANAGYCRRPIRNYENQESENKLINEFKELKKNNDLSGINFLELI